jgi:hypothetical protein
MTYVKYLRRAIRQKQIMGLNWRMGQAYFNTLADVRSDLADLVRGSHLDPYYNDNRINEFLAFVAERW